MWKPPYTLLEAHNLCQDVFNRRPESGNTSPASVHFSMFFTNQITVHFSARKPPKYC